ncbi:hypothetical protein ACFX43_09410 [Nocardioides sp. YIM B13467]|uniref:hypothetical protein n=1 Tax=Nocardioides sp. YIM B13467 TaxID=3366294 RepID=UPI0036729FE1
MMGTGGMWLWMGLGLIGLWALVALAIVWVIGPRRTDGAPPAGDPTGEGHRR